MPYINSRKLSENWFNHLAFEPNSPKIPYQKSLLFFESASGSELLDVDGNRYIDFCNCWGSVYIGHNDEEINISKKVIVIRLKALIARNLWDTSAYYEIANELNDALVKAIEEINSNTFKKEKLVYK